MRYKLEIDIELKKKQVSINNNHLVERVIKPFFFFLKFQGIT